MCLRILVIIKLPLVWFLRDHSDKNAQKCKELLRNGTQRGKGAGARAETLRDVAGRVNEGASKFW